MKKHLFITALLMLTVINYTGAQIYAKNEAGFITYNEIVDVDSISRKKLYSNAITWITTLKKLGHKIEFSVKDSINGKLVTKNEFSVYTGSGVLEKLSGKFNYHVTIEVKDNRYRYTITDFIYHEYKPDRYHNIQATGKTKNLEETKATGWQKLWDKHRKTLDEKIKKDISNLKVYMITKPQVSDPLPPKKEVKWGRLGRSLKSSRTNNDRAT